MSVWQVRYWRALELDRDAADQALGRTGNEQFVVDGRFRERFAEEVANRNEHLPLGAHEIHEREALADLQVPAAIEAGTRLGSVGANVGAVEFVEHEYVRGALRQFGFERRREVVDALELVAQR